jgi:hypothetical protein
MRTDRQTRRRQ